jgi:hypothetical protein
MKRKLLGAALALLMTSGAASAYPNGLSKIDFLVITYVAGSGDCPRFKFIPQALREEAEEENKITKEMLSARLGVLIAQVEKNASNRNGLLDTPVGDDKKLLLLTYWEYLDDPSDFCAKMWALLGPNGTYKRQMLEAK